MNLKGSDNDQAIRAHQSNFIPFKMIEQKGIEKITFPYTALDGKFKELKIPIANHDQAERTLADGEYPEVRSARGNCVAAFMKDRQNEVQESSRGSHTRT